MAIILCVKRAPNRASRYFYEKTPGGRLFFERKEEAGWLAGF